MAKYHLTQQDRDFIGRTLKEFKGRGRGELPLPRRRRVLEGGGGGSTTLRRARVYDGPISAATSNLEADWGTGNVRFMNDETGELDTENTAVENQWDNEWVEDAMVEVNTAFTPPRVVNGTCAAFTSWE